MKKILVALMAVFFIQLMLFQPAVASTESATTITGAGSTFAQVILGVWGDAFYTQSNNTVQLSYAGVGSGQGIASISNLSVDFAGSDAPLSPTQQASANTTANSKGNYYGAINTIPESAGGIVMAYNIPSNEINGHLNLTADLIAKIMQVNITHWNDPAILAQNPGLTDTAAISVVHRADASGTTYAFSDYLTRAASTGTWVLGQSTTLPWPSSTTGAKGNSAVAGTITKTSNSIGYVELAYALQNKISTAFLQNKAGDWVNATLEGITNAVNTATSSLPSSTGDWSHVSINNQGGATTYPICTFTYLLVYSNLTALGTQGPALVSFLKYIMTTAAQNKAPSIGYVPLPSSLLTKNLAVINSLTVAQPTPTSSTSTAPGFEFISVASLFVVASVFLMLKRKNKMN